jgi:pimeloyl-ACP methyl ester carboxylesterase
MGEKRETLAVRLGSTGGFINVRIWQAARPKGRVVCLHALGASGCEFGVLAEHLNAEGYEVVCPDWIGHGDSQFFHDPAAYRWDQFVRCLGFVYQRYQAERTHFLGASWGAMMLFLFLLSYRIEPRSAIFVDPALRNKPALSRTNEILHDRSKATFGSFEEAEAYLHGQRPDLSLVPERFRHYYRAGRFHERAGKIAFKFDPAVMEAMANDLQTPFNHLGAVARIRFDALFLYGERSAFREPATCLTASARNSKLCCHDRLDAGHPPSLLQKDHLVPISEFLDRVEARAAGQPVRL